MPPSILSNNDSLESVISTNETTDSVVLDKKQDIRIGGRHPISLHWISWNKPGYADVEPVDDEWYSINGRQSNDNGDYLIIEGKIRRISEKELEFIGEIVTRYQYNNNGEPCIKNGVQKFFGKGNRTYFRLQNMANCEGRMLVDYVDIFPGNSTL